MGRHYQLFPSNQWGMNKSCSPILLPFILILLFYVLGAGGSVLAQKVSEQDSYLSRLKTYPPETLMNFKRVKKAGSIRYPVRERDVALNCLNRKEMVPLPASLNQFIFSGCERVSLDNWKGKYETVTYDEVWTYEIFNKFTEDVMTRTAIYWKEAKFVLEIGYYPDGFLNVVRDRVYYDNSGI